ncbi:MAG: M20/M25/M40 family metallo-hydrolase, partial [Pseudomonadota bacterium]
MRIDAVLDRIDNDLPNALGRLMGFLRIPSISTDPAFDAQTENAADWLVSDLQSIGIKSEKRMTPGHPMVVGHINQDATHGPHLLFYGHYDVQPVDPLELWHSDPFAPEIQDTDKGRVIRGRGSSDDKGQL